MVLQTYHSDPRGLVNVRPWVYPSQDPPYICTKKIIERSLETCPICNAPKPAALAIPNYCNAWSGTSTTTEEALDQLRALKECLRLSPSAQFDLTPGCMILDGRDKKSIGLPWQVVRFLYETKPFICDVAADKELNVFNQKVYSDAKTGPGEFFTFENDTFTNLDDVIRTAGAHGVIINPPFYNRPNTNGATKQTITGWALKLSECLARTAQHKDGSSSQPTTR